jgi:hypothetical protein
MPQDTHRLKLRLPPGLMARTEEAAHKAARSVDSEIIRRLEQSFATDEALRAVPSRTPEQEFGRCASLQPLAWPSRASLRGTGR